MAFVFSFGETVLKRNYDQGAVMKNTILISTIVLTVFVSLFAQQRTIDKKE